MKPRIAVVGAGVGGLATSIALEQLGIETTVFERARQPSRRGAALWLTGNAVQALSLLGVGEEVREAATEVRRQLYCSWSGDIVWRVPLERLSKRPVLLIGRDRLVTILRRAVDPRRIRWRAPCCGVVELDDGVRPLFLTRTIVAEPGEPLDERFDGLVAADGFRSPIRRQLFGPEPTPPGSQAWAGVAETAASRWPYRPGDSVHFVGQGQFMATATLANGDDTDVRRVTWYAVVSRAASGRPLTEAELGRRFPPRVAELVRASANPIAFQLRDRNPLRRWGRGRVTFLGDAIHPTRPEAGQGAAQALVGAVTLSRCLASAEVSEAFRAYEACHRRRTSRAVRLSRLLCLNFHLPIPEPVRKALIYGGLPLFLDVYRDLIADPF